MSEQEQFEKWASVDGSVMRNIEMRSNGQYQNSNTQHAWRGWKECAALKDTELSREKAGNEAWEAEHIKDMGVLNKRIKELEGKAAGYTAHFDDGYSGNIPYVEELTEYWNPLEDDGDALRLAVKLHLDVTFTESLACCEYINVTLDNDPYAATRRAIVRAAAEIGKGMK